MKAYFDKSNFESFIIQRPKDIRRFEICNDMIKRHLDVKLNMTLADFQSSQLCVSWLTTMTDGARKFPKPCPEEFSFSRDGNIETFTDGFSKEDFSSVFLLDDTKVDDLKSKGNLLVGKKGEELDLLERLIVDEDNNFITSLPPKEYFVGSRDWSPLNPYVRPCTDIIIRDAFLLFNDRLHPYSKNLYSLLLKLTEGISDTTICIVIVCMKQNTDANHYEPDWAKVRSNIKKLLKDQRNIEAKITYIVADLKKEIGHDRTIFTNYIHYMPNDCIGNFYGLNGDYSSESDQFDLRCIATEKLYKEAFGFIQKIQGLIYEIMIGNVQGGEIKEDPSGGLLSNYLIFS